MYSKHACSFERLGRRHMVGEGKYDRYTNPVEVTRNGSAVVKMTDYVPKKRVHIMHDLVASSKYVFNTHHA